MQTICHPFPVVQMGHRQSRHAHDSVHRRADVVAHGGQEIAFRPVCFFRSCQCFFQRFLCLALRRQHIGHIRPHQAHGPMVLVSPKHVDLLIPQPFPIAIGQNKVIPSRLFIEPFEKRLDLKLGLRLIFFLIQMVMADEFLYIRIIKRDSIRRQVFEHRLTSIHGQPSATNVDKRHQLERIGHHVQKPLLFAKGVGDIRSGKAYPSKAQIDSEDRHVFRADIPVVVYNRKRKRIGVFRWQTSKHLLGIQARLIGFSVPWHHSFRKHTGYPLGVASAAGR